MYGNNPTQFYNHFRTCLAKEYDLVRNAEMTGHHASMDHGGGGHESDLYVIENTLNGLNRESQKLHASISTTRREQGEHSLKEYQLRDLLRELYT